MIGPTALFGLAAVAGIAFGVIGLRATVHMGRKVTQLETRLTESEDRLLDLGRLATALADQTGSQNMRLDKLQVRQERLDAMAGKTGFSEAIALTRHGADTRELVDTCGLSQGEARLVSVLYGKTIDETKRTMDPAIAGKC